MLVMEIISSFKEQNNVYITKKPFTKDYSE